ncbi:MAG: pantetheine-phosphate adenylyltransferase [Bacteroidaceae bacterium]|jgi:pantetheine-phosphate adenylyltransferase|nr:pantetheine-phosphate adenylyltransferase [Bacteroidaceae bacterium]
MKLFFPGSFDPFTIGHADLVERVLDMGCEVVIAVGINEGKKPLFSLQQRLEAIRNHYKGYSRVSVTEYKGLTVDAVRENGCDAILRGIRSVSDYDNERNMADINRSIDGVETVLLVASPAVQHVSSSLVRELISFGRNADDLMIDTFK